MPDDPLKAAVENLTAADLTVDASGRVVIEKPDIAKLLKPGSEIVEAARDDTNIICCGNGKCAQRYDSLLDQVIRSRL